MKKYKKIIGGTIKEAEKKFPWLQQALFEDAVINISWKYLVWKAGTWKDGVWEGGTWEGGFWEGGTWKDGIWKGGTWKKGLMWSNLQQDYVQIRQADNNTFKEARE